MAWHFYIINMLWHGYTTPDSMGVQYSNGKSCDLADHSNKHFGPKTGFLKSGFQTTVWLPFDNQTQICHSNTRLVRYSDGYCIQIELKLFSSKQYKVLLFGNWLIRDVSNRIFIDIIVKKIAINHINTFLRYNFNNLSGILILGVPEIKLG